MSNIDEEFLRNRIKTLEEEVEKGRFQLSTISGALLLANEFLSLLLQPEVLDEKEQDVSNSREESQSVL